MPIHFTNALALMSMAHLMNSNDVVTIRNNVTTIMCPVTPAPGMTNCHGYCLIDRLLYNEEILIYTTGAPNIHVYEMIPLQNIATGYQCTVALKL